MTEQGIVGQASNGDGFGMVHIGGSGMGSWIRFSIDEEGCTPPVLQRIQLGDIPTPNPGFPVTFDVSSSDGSLMAINLR
jgi:hypothetical protein